MKLAEVAPRGHFYVIMQRDFLRGIIAQRIAQGYQPFAYCYTHVYWSARALSEKDAPTQLKRVVAFNLRDLHDAGDMAGPEPMLEIGMAYVQFDEELNVAIKKVAANYNKHEVQITDVEVILYSGKEVRSSLANYFVLR